MDIVIPERCYRILLHCFPRRFRAEAEGDLLDCFRQSWAEASGRGKGARLRLGMTLLLDTMRSAPPEWLAAGVSPTPTPGKATPVQTFRQDLRYALRWFRRAPMVTVVTALTVAIGIGATTTMLSVANALLLRPPAGVREAGQLVTVHAMSEDGSSFHSFSYPDSRDLMGAESGLSDLAPYSVFAGSLKTGEDPELRAGMEVSANYFRTVGARPALGRFFVPEEDGGPGGPRVVVLSHALWQQRFAGDSAMVGRAVQLNGQPFTVVGVAEPGFRGHAAAIDFSLWVPLALDAVVSNRQVLESRQNSFLEIVARLAPGASRERATAALNRTYAGGGNGGGLGKPRRLELRRYSAIPGQFFLPALGFLGMLMVLAALVLLIASANVANVLLARASARGKEIAVRLAIGASRGRLVRQLVTESVLLFLMGGSAGTLLAVYATKALGAFQPPVSIPLTLDFHVDVRVLVVTLGVTLLTGIVFGLAPALQATRFDLTRALKDEPGSARVGRFRLRGAFVVAQVAGTTLLLVTAGLFTRALGRAGSIDLGFDPASVQVLSLEMGVKGATPTEVATFADRLIERTRGLAGVEAAAATNFLPINMGNRQTVVSVAGREARPNVGQFQVDFASVTPDYFRALAMPLVRGRAFGPADRTGSAPVAIINETLARRIWPGEDAVGKRFRFGDSDTETPTEIVGIAKNAKYRSIGDEGISMVYTPLAQQGGRSFELLVRSRPEAPSPAPALRALVRELDPALPIQTNLPYRDIIGVSLLPNRIAVGLAMMFGATGLVLAAVGLYGVLSYMVSRRRREIGIRMALGAATADVRALVLRDGLRLTGIGVVMGCGIAVAVTRLLGSLLFGISPLDPITYGTIVLLLLTVAWVACAMPVRRALATEPLEVLRHD